MQFLSAFSLFSMALAAPAPLVPRANPTVVAPAAQATIAGVSGDRVESFKAIPFAQPPVGQLRLKPPQPITAALGNVDGTKDARACPQFFFSVADSNIPGNVLGTLLNTPIFQAATNAGEDCLTINVQRPTGTKAGDKLPVLFWIYGGAFELGSTSMYDGSSLVTESVAQGKPIIFVAVNYRVGGFGFMPGKEILADGSANLGLLDQRLGLEWVADNIAAFGGDPDKVTIWGESAGAISVMDQMMLYDGDNNYKGKPLFRAGIMNSGSIVPADPVDCPKGQAIYDTVVKEAGCAGSSDTLSCLREVPYTKFLSAANSVPGVLSYFTVNLSYLPRPDGKTLTASPDTLVVAGKYAKVPFIVGDQEDEGTLFGLFTANLTTKAELTTYLSEIFFNSASPSDIARLVDSYQNTLEDGSPFRTGLLNNLFPQFKRFSAIIGDLTFTLSRRLFLETAAQANPNVPSWSYLSTYNFGFPILGTFHGSDLLQVFYGVLPNNAAKSIRGYYYNFVYDLNPNVGNDYGNWPQWSEGQQLREFKASSNDYLNDDFRSDTYAILKQNIGSLKV
ncbi:hypothetical protein IAQ61_007573 [Plenodomus lingam]|uniref:Carboxylic ester hydrolase n=1 Tax=Leptosphaeria maculans (strain JN3 / isolate v23.1.3 / race Av1-4-5-6-7-8) TaxID=985895 RepID=E5A5B3_LEPMJ|nr:similar to lipase [Plenodomus lingam JN3]KAH9866983.1 hypothetical protein IAQ61_007573 [Plenodomus lingam]CBX98811.1 similar to lipase [Plenodomus lingam JN3]